MKKILCASVLVVALTLVLMACEKDDICGKDEPTTPSLLLEFYDYNDQNRQMNNLVEAYVSGRENEIIKSNGYKLKLPLKLAEPETSWILKTTVIVNNQQQIKLDTLTFKYVVNTHYLNKACGYISTFSLKQDGTSPLLNGSATITTGNWIKFYITETNEIQDDKKAHFKIYY